MESTDKKFLGKSRDNSDIKIGVFDSGIGGFSVLGALFTIFPEATYFYYSDDAYAPYGPKTDEFITERALAITKDLLGKGVQLIVVACNTATAASIETLRSNYNQIPFVGVEPYLNAYYKMPEGPLRSQNKMMVLTTESTGKSERFKRLREKLDPDSQIDHYSLKNLARLIEEFYYSQNTLSEQEKFKLDCQQELSFLKDKNYAFAILGCTHYPLVRQWMEEYLRLKTISPDEHVAQRVLSLIKEQGAILDQKSSEEFFFYSSKTKEWKIKKRAELYGPFKNHTQG